MGFKSFEGDPKTLIAPDLYIENSDSKSRSASLASGKKDLQYHSQEHLTIKKLSSHPVGFPEAKYSQIIASGFSALGRVFIPHLQGYQGSI